MSFRKASKWEAKQAFLLVESRMKWMDEKGIDMWKKVKYDELYPLSYYEECAENGQLYVVSDARNHIVCAGVVTDKDPKWDYQIRIGFEDKALYIKNLVSEIGTKKTSEEFVEGVEKLAKAQKIPCLRADVDAASKPLAYICRSLGFVAVGDCKDGDYEGVLRQKDLAD